MSDKKISGYELSRNWFDWTFENPGKVNPNHTALYFFIIEHSNRLGWKPIFGLPSGFSMEAIGIKSYNTYIKTLNELIGFGFVRMVEKSKNQYTANIIALSNINKALDKALDKALIMHTTKQMEGIDSIIKLLTNNNETNKQKEGARPSLADKEYFNACKKIWYEHHPQWQFSAKDGSGLKSAIEQIKKFQEAGNKDITPEAVAAAFNFILSHPQVKNNEFFSTANPSTISSKLNTIIELIKNENGKSKFAGSKRDAFSNFA